MLYRAVEHGYIKGCIAVCTVDEYWPRIRRIPLHPDWESDDGDAVICRTFDGMGIVRVTKPEKYDSDEKREAGAQFYEESYRPNLN